MISTWSMLIICTIFIACVSQTFQTSTEQNRMRCERRVAVCENSEGVKRQVCGTDNQTYPSRCHLQRAQCRGDTVSLKHKGPCTEKSFTRRRSSVRGQRNKKGCSRADREQFNQNLVKLLTNEYDRVRSAPPQGTDKQIAVIEWKYSDLDKDSSGTMQKIEYRELRRLVKKVVKPKRCAKNFIRVCDRNRDEIISKQEWANCLTSAEGLNYEEEGDNEDDLGLHETSEPDYNEDDLGPMGVLQGSINQVQTFTDLEEPVEHQSKDETETENNDCLSDRKAVLDEQKNGDTVLYVPECTTDGRYQKVQCYHSTGYCWCVHEDTGKPIPGSSVKDQHPKCEALTALNRPMKGCPDNKKTQFLRNLMDFLWSKMSSANGTVSGTSEIIKWQVSKEEQTAMWTFVMLDKDKNKVLERREWKSFHNLIISNQLLKRCGKKLPRFCDVNHDRKISITEWLGCLNAQRAASPNTSTLSPILTPASKRKGPNPLESILKAED